MTSTLSSECQRGENFKQTRTHGRSNYDSHNGSHVCSECQSGSKQARVNGRSNHVPLVCGCVCGCGCGVCGVSWQHAHMLKHMCSCCQYTRGRFERTHGDVLSGHTGFFSVSHTTHHTPHRTHTTPQHTTATRPQHHTETGTERERQTETERETEKEDREIRQGQREKRRRKRQQKREDSSSGWWCMAVLS